ncbi:translocation/assembly module TamB domain-containing protein [Silanimonas sp.]|jgi:translocation and assembly module TamB|uniref:translocation/assembly module TamB domain-containing protein n=1 Tax=Silanimonas sp. TaxID=1929290 RepID=UPI0037C551E3
MASLRVHAARLWRWAWLGGVALIAAAALGGWWLLGSGGGRDAALDRVIAALPEGTLRIGGREGSLAGGLRLRDVVYEDATVRVEIGVLDATPRPPGLGEPTVNLASLRLRGVRVWPKDVPDEPTPSWPGMLPRLDLPISVRVDTVEVRDIVVQPAGEASPPIVIDRVAGALALQPGRLALDSLELEAPQGRVRGALQYLPSEDFATRLALDGELAAGARMALRLDGTLATGRATLEGRTGGPLRMAFDWQDAARLDTLGWSFALDATQLEIASLGLPVQAPIDATLRAHSVAAAPGDELVATPGLRVGLTGRVAQDGVDVALRDSRLRLHDGVLHAEPLALSLLDGRVDLTGTYGLDDGAADLVARVDAVSWGEGEARVQADGTATFAGHVDDWSAELDLDLARGGQRATLTGLARGDAEAIVLAPFTLATPGGSLEGEARYARDATAAFALDATMRELDPAWLAPEWPGRIEGTLRVDGAAPADGPLRYVAELASLTGTLRGQRIDGEAQVEARGNALQVQAELALGEGRVAVDGALAPALDLEVALRTLEVAPWLDGARGVLDGRLQVSGTAERPAIEVDLALLDGGWQDVTLQRLTARGSLPARGDGRIAVRADALAQGKSRIASIELALEGRVDSGRFTLAARGIDAPNLPAPTAGARGRLEARGAWRSSDGFERGELTLDTLDGELPALPLLALDAPATMAWRGADWSLPSPVCLRLAKSGRLCAEGDADDARLAGEALDLAWLAPFLPDDLDTPLAPSGLVALQAARRWVDGSVVTTARVDAPQGRLRVGGVAPETVFGWNGLVLEATQSDGWRVDLRADLLPDGRLEARASADAAGVLDGQIALRATDLSLLEVVSADLVAPRGTIDGRLVLSGTVEAPRWQGALAAAPFAVELPALGIAIDEGELRIEGGEDGQLRLRGRLPTGDGALEIAGQWSEDDRPNRVTIRGTDVRVLDTPDGRAWISPALDLEVADGVARLRGRIDVPRAELALDRFEQGAAASPDVVVIDDPTAEASAAGLQLDADFTVALGDDVRLRGFGFDGRLSGELKLRDRIDREPRARGTLELAGEVRAYGQQLDLERGTLRWGNVAIDEPTIDVRAVRPDSEPEVGVAVTGTGVSPIVDVWSRPALPQAEALSWLMFGRPLASADGNDAAQLEQAATSLGGSAVAQAVAGKVGLDTASVGESRALGGTALTVGKRITPKLYVSYGMALSGTGQVVTVTYALRRWLAAQVETGIEQRIELEAKFERD